MGGRSAISVGRVPRDLFEFETRPRTLNSKENFNWIINTTLSSFYMEVRQNFNAYFRFKGANVMDFSKFK